ncbi:unnamed protein product [Owenia fusiformis]|uniref:Uncharacterized protein n=1 Tax=Owenia fusiformis TaxID=6347 RepID=A0A8J1XES9_OWEFU|nr:unnamed protein product [Owenia fusiformis]
MKNQMSQLSNHMQQGNKQNQQLSNQTHQVRSHTVIDQVQKEASSEPQSPSPFNPAFIETDLTTPLFPPKKTTTSEHAKPTDPLDKMNLSTTPGKGSVTATTATQQSNVTMATGSAAPGGLNQPQIQPAPAVQIAMSQAQNTVQIGAGQQQGQLQGANTVQIGDQQFQIINFPLLSPGANVTQAPNFQTQVRNIVPVTQAQQMRLSGSNIQLPIRFINPQGVAPRAASGAQQTVMTMGNSLNVGNIGNNQRFILASPLQPGAIQQGVRMLNPTQVSNVQTIQQPNVHTIQQSNAIMSGGKMSVMTPAQTRPMVGQAQQRPILPAHQNTSNRYTQPQNIPTPRQISPSPQFQNQIVNNMQNMVTNLQSFVSQDSPRVNVLPVHSQSSQRLLSAPSLSQQSHQPPVSLTPQPAHQPKPAHSGSVGGLKYSPPIQPPPAHTGAVQPRSAISPNPQIRSMQQTPRAAHKMPVMTSKPPSPFVHRILSHVPNVQALRPRLGQQQNGSQQHSGAQSGHQRVLISGGQQHIMRDNSDLSSSYPVQPGGINPGGQPRSMMPLSVSTGQNTPPARSQAMPPSAPAAHSNRSPSLSPAIIGPNQVPPYAHTPSSPHMRSTPSPHVHPSISPHIHSSISPHIHPAVSPQRHPSISPQSQLPAHTPILPMPSNPIFPTSSPLAIASSINTATPTMSQPVNLHKPAFQSPQIAPRGKSPISPRQRPPKSPGSPRRSRSPGRALPSPLRVPQIKFSSTSTNNVQNKNVVLSSDQDTKPLDGPIEKMDVDEDGHKQANGVPVEYNNDEEFVWDEYLEDTGAIAAPPTSFKHVEDSLQSGFTKGMKLEVANKTSNSTYWVTSVVMTCNQLLRLRYDGYGEDSSADFWCDIQTSDIHPIGWCAQNGKSLQPPEAIKNKYTNWSEFLVNTLTGARTAPAYLLDKTTGTTPIDQIKQGMKLEAQHVLSPTTVWIVEVLENVGGRLLLRYECAQTASHDFWLFYLDLRLHPLGWGQEQRFQYFPPAELQVDAATWSERLNAIFDDTEQPILPPDIFKDQEKLEEHKFQFGWKLEVLDTNNHTDVCPGHVIEVVNSNYFIAEIDDLSDNPEKLRVCCHKNTPGIFPVDWCKWNGVRLAIPRGWPKDKEFNWQEYMEETKTTPAPENAFNLKHAPEHDFERGMKMEAVNPRAPHQICAATITKIIHHLIFVHLDSSATVIGSHILGVNSHHIFPVGWCESNGYPIKPPRNLAKLKRSRDAIVAPTKNNLTPDEFRSHTYSEIRNGEAGGKPGWCPKIYFNHRCFSGPFLSKGRIADLPKCVGPGPIVLVLKEVLSLLINSAYKSSRVLREVQLDGAHNPKMYQQQLKAKYKGKSYRATVEICQNNAQIEEYCRMQCIKLQCCPYLFSPHYVNDNCPENCNNLTKTKYNMVYGTKKKKRKIGRPPGGHTNLEEGDKKKPGKRGRKRKKFLFSPRKQLQANATKLPNGDMITHNASNLADGAMKIDDDAQSVHSRISTDSQMTEKTSDSRDFDPEFRPPKKKYIKHNVVVKSDIRTRGKKLPSFGLAKKTRKKKLILTNGDLNGLEEPPKSAFQPVEPTNVEPPLKLESNPLYWSVDEVAEFITTTDCANLSRILAEQEIDGQALLLLSLPSLQEHLELKLGPAIKLCHHIERVKLSFFDQWADLSNIQRS